MSIYLMKAGKKILIYLSVIGSIIALLASNVSLITPGMMDFFAGEYQNICITCPILEDLLKAISEAIDTLYGKVTGGLVAVLGAVYALWLTVFVMKQIATAKFENPQEFYSKLLKKTILVIFIAAMVGSVENLQEVINVLLLPFIQGFMEFSLLILKSSGVSIDCSITLDEVAEASTEITGFLKGFDEPIKCLVDSMHKSIASGVVMGAKMLSSQTYGIWTEIVGLFVFVLFLLFDLLFPLQLFDSIFRMGLMMMLFPLALMLAAFDSTRKYLGIVFIYFIATVVHIAILSVVFAVCISVVDEVMKNSGFLDIALTQKLTDEKIVNMSSLWMEQFIMVVILFYMFNVMNLFNNLIVMIMGLDMGDAMSSGVGNKVMNIGLSAKNKVKSMFK